MSAESTNLFLSAEERYKVWCIKVAERPELLEVYGGGGASKTKETDELLEQDATTYVEISDTANQTADNSCEYENDKDSDPDNDVALTDGCDIPNWRQRHFIPVSPQLEAALRVGSGCPLFRRESQLPLVGWTTSAKSATTLPLWSSKNSDRRSTKWKKLQQHLFKEPLAPPANFKIEECAKVRLERLEPMVVDYYHADLKNNFPSTGRTFRDPPPSFERDSIPALICGCTTEDDWPCRTSMTWTSLVQRFGCKEHDELEWRFSDTHGFGMSLHTYQKYCNSIEGLTDDAPLAIYDSQFHHGNDPRSCLVNEFKVPTCFQYDLFACLPEQVVDSDDDEIPLRPPYQWILMGPERSGTGLHVDPIGTHAWVTLLEGCKRWVLFHPDTPHAAIAYSKTKQVQSVIWFDEWWVGGKILETLGQDDDDDSTEVVIRYVEFLQKPGETIYVPAGWPHLVLNLEASVAVTQNYATEYPSFAQFWKAVQAEGSLLQRQMLYQSLRQNRPDLISSINDAMLPPVLHDKEEKEDGLAPS